MVSRAAVNLTESELENTSYTTPASLPRRVHNQEGDEMASHNETDTETAELGRQSKRLRVDMGQDVDLYIAINRLEKIREMHAQGRPIRVQEAQDYTGHRNWYQYAAMPTLETQATPQSFPLSNNYNVAAIPPSAPQSASYQPTQQTATTNQRPSVSTISTTLQTPSQREQGPRNEHGMFYVRFFPSDQNQHSHEHQFARHHVGLMHQQQFRQPSNFTRSFDHQHNLQSRIRLRHATYSRQQQYQHDTQQVNPSQGQGQQLWTNESFQLLAGQSPESNAVEYYRFPGSQQMQGHQHQQQQQQQHHHHQREHTFVFVRSYVFTPPWHHTLAVRRARRVQMTEQATMQQEERDFIEAQTQSLHEYENSRGVDPSLAKASMPKPPDTDPYPGFTRVPTAETICVACDTALHATAWFVRQCGHVYCAGCATTQKTASTSKCSAQHCSISALNIYREVYF